MTLKTTLSLKMAIIWTQVQCRDYANLIEKWDKLFRRVNTIQTFYKLLLGRVKD